MSRAGIWLGILATFSALAAPAAGGRFDKMTVPLKWMEGLVPEDVAEPTYPDYDQNNALEKARAQIWAGQYRRGLATLASVGNGKELDVAILKGQAMLALGRYDNAMAALSGQPLSEDAAVQSLRSQVLAEQGRYDEAIDAVNTAITKDPAGIGQRY
jgi:tetratricopeptide (TPR) repeat protein